MTRFVLIILVLLMLAFLVRFAYWAFRPHRTLSHNRTRHQNLRLHLRLHPGPGHATAFAMHWHWSRFATFRVSKWERPSLSMWRRLTHPDSHSVGLGRGHYRHNARIPVQEHALLVAPPRSFKSALLADAVIRYPGPVVCTSMKDDLFLNTSGIRQNGRLPGLIRRFLAWIHVIRPFRSMGGPVHTFNPEGYGGWPSTIAWNLINGCKNISTAERRAEMFCHAINTRDVEHGDWFRAKCAEFLTALFHAAALLDGDLRLIADWLFDKDAINIATSTLEKNHSGQMAASLRDLHSEQAEKTAAAVRMVMSNCLRFTMNPELARCVLPVSGSGFDARKFLLSGSTLYLIATGQQKSSPVAPLFACLVDEIQHTAHQMALENQQAKRLDPPLLLALDEVTQICPVPLDNWLAMAGGLGVQVIAVVHDYSQLRARWEEDGAKTILGTAGCKVIFGGLSDAETLEKLGKLCGSVNVKTKGHDGHSPHDAMTPGMIRQLPNGFALVLRNNKAHLIIKVRRVWKDRLYKRARRRNALIADLAPVEAYRDLGQVGDAMAQAGRQRMAGFSPAPADHPNGNGTAAHNRASHNDSARPAGDPWEDAEG
jgi:type IV secretion system protein VirD4